MKALAHHHVDPPAQLVLEEMLYGNEVDKTEPDVRSNVYKHVDIAVWPRRASCGRAKKSERLESAPTQGLLECLELSVKW
jgi:hypothetical protein